MRHWLFGGAIATSAAADQGRTLKRMKKTRMNQVPPDGNQEMADLASQEMTRLLTLVEEATRSSKEGVKYFVEPASGSLRRATSRQHHMVFGRRGSGKSSLLRKAAADLTVDRKPIAWVDLEPFKQHSYPDLLLSVLIASLNAFKDWLDTAAVAPATRKSFWHRLFDKTPTKSAYNRNRCKALSETLSRHITDLKAQLHSIDLAEVEVKASASKSSGAEMGASSNIASPVGSLGANLKATEATGQSSEVHERYRRSKVEFLRRHIMDYQAVFEELASISEDNSFLFLDDLYHIIRKDQPQVIDYFHSIAKGHNLWLKIGSIRHRTDWYVHGNPPIGVKLGDDADEINLDLTLEKYELTKEFLAKVLDNMIVAAGMTGRQFLTAGAVDRLVLASGGVARDFLSIFRRSVDIARERKVDRIGAEDINVAAGEYDTIKREEFKRDTYSEEEGTLDRVFQEVRGFCLERANSNCFLLHKDLRNAKTDAIHELVDLKLLHLIRSRVTVNTRQGRIYEAYMLDLSQYAGARKRRGLDIVEFWKTDSKDKLRKTSWIFGEQELESDH